MVLPFAMEGGNAFYYRDGKMLIFGYFKSVQDQDKYIYTNRSFDITAHEVGHGILDVFQPDLLSGGKQECKALQESFGDLTAIFAVLSSMDSVTSLLVACRGDLHCSNFLNQLGEQMGLGLLGTVGVRNLDANVAMDEVTEEEHDLSTVFTGAVYDAFVDIFERDIDLDRYDPAYTLYLTGKHFCEIVAAGFANATQKDLTFKGVALKIMEAEKNEKNRAILKAEFDKRKIFDPNAKPKPMPKPQEAPAEGESEETATAGVVTGRCGTMDEKAMAKVKAMLKAKREKAAKDAQKTAAS